MIPELNERSQTILRQIVDLYMETGQPVGSRTISERLGLALSPASIRNVMADLEAEGLLFAPHTSAGRLPTQAGLRFYVDGLMQIGDLTGEERAAIELRCSAAGRSMEQVLGQASALLSGLSAAAGLVVAPTADKPIRQIQFVQVEPRRLLVILVSQDNMVENRMMEVEGPLPPGALLAASNYINEKLAGRTLSAARAVIMTEIASHKSQLDTLTADLVRRGIALNPAREAEGHIIIRGQSHLLQDVKAVEDLERARTLLAMLEEERTMARLLEAAQSANGIQIYIGTENKMFEHSGWSMVISPYRSPQNQIIGAIGVIGPTRLNYSRVIPLVDYTSQVMERLLGGGE
jgi:heat-inducible transcriptional repressor